MITKFGLGEVKVNHKDKVIVIYYNIFSEVYHNSQKIITNRGKKLISWLCTQENFFDYKIVIYQSSEPISNAGMPSSENEYLKKYLQIKDLLAKFNVWLISDMNSDEFANWVKSNLGWNHLTYHFHFDFFLPTNQNYLINNIKERTLPFSKDFFTCNGNMSSKHRILIKKMWTELNLWDNSYWSFADSSNFGEKFLDIRLDLFAVWQYGLRKLNNCFLHIVTETIYENNFWDTNIRMDFMSKLGRALATPTPFIAYGNYGLIKHLKELGFKTFDNWWDESYDEIEDFTKRLQSIKKIVINLTALSMEDKIRIRNEMIPIFIHNRVILSQMIIKEKGKINLEIPNFFNNFVYESIEYDDGKI